MPAARRRLLIRPAEARRRGETSELGATPDDVPAAFARYERILRPTTDEAQTFVMPPIGHPHSEWQRRVLRGGLRVLGGPVGRALNRVRATVPSPPVDTIALPDYPTRRPERV